MLGSSDVAHIMGELTKIHTIEHDKVVCHCPMARWHHQSGLDNSPSFAVMKGRTGWWVNCLACRYRKTLEGLIWDYMGRTKKPLTKIMALMYHKEQEHSVIKSTPVKEFNYNPFGEYKAKNRPAFKRKEYAESVGIQVDLFGREQEPVVEDRPSAIDLDKWENQQPPMAYVEKRGITYEAYKEWRLGHDPFRRRLMFPVFNTDGEYVGYTGRLYEDGVYCFKCGEYLMYDKTHGITGEVVNKKHFSCPKCKTSHAKYKHFKGKWRRNVIYGLHRKVSGPIVVTEGTMDAIRLWMLGIARPVCILGANLSPNQILQLKKEADTNLEYPLIFMGDGDSAGREMASEGVKAMNNVGINSFLLDCPADDPDSMTLEQALSIFPAVAFR